MRIQKTFFHLGILFLFTFCGCATARSNGYLIKIPEITYYQLFPQIMSENGKVIMGNSDTIGPWIWTRDLGVRPLLDVPKTLTISIYAMNFNGGFAAGLAVGSDSNARPFLWSSKIGFSLLPELPDSYKAYPPFSISDDGERGTFFCYKNTFPLIACSNLDSQNGSYSLAEKLWTSTNGFENLPTVPFGLFDYVRASRNMKYYLASALASGQFGRLSLDGTFVPFEGIPEGFNTKSDVIIANANDTFVVDQSRHSSDGPIIWNYAGKQVHLIELPQGCETFAVTAIDNDGAIFGNTSCKSSSGHLVGLRIENLHPQLISAWLEGAGVSNTLSRDTHVIFVSDDGKTIFGDTNFTPIVGADDSPQGNINTIPSRPSLPDLAPEEGYFFVAHLP